MVSLKGVVKSRLFISLVGLLALAVLIWFVGPLIAIGGHAPLQGALARVVGILVCGLLWLLNALRRQWQLSRANRQLVGQVEAAAADDPLGEQSREEVDALRERFDDALKVLRKANRKGDGTGIYDLPWYIIIGPPGSGKTTSLVNSGLRFPLADKFGKAALRGVGGTRNCDWWFTEDAVLLDTAGRYTTQDSHQALDSTAWDGFLQLLKKHRRRRPINGVLVAVSVTDLMQKGEAERQRQQHAIKQRLLELDQQLGTRFPVYVMFTKGDLIAGFTEFFEDLGAAERAQVWGVTFAYGEGTAEEQLAGFKQEFSALVQRADQRVPWRVQHERDPRRRARIFAFPRQLASLGQVIDEFLQAVFSPSRYGEPPLVRGVYLTSGTQEGTPIDRIMGSLSRSFGFDAQAVAPPAGQGKSFFITRLLRDVVFPEAELVGTNRRLETQRKWLQRSAYVAALACTGIAALAWMTSFTRNQVYVHRAKEALAHYQEVAVPAAAERAQTFDDALPQLDAARALAEVYAPFAGGVSPLMGLGLYQGDSLSEAGTQAYRAELQRQLLPAIRARLEHHLRSGAGDPDYQYEALKTYLMLGDHAHLDADLLRLWMQLDWSAMYPADPHRRGELEQHLDHMLALGFDPIDLDRDLVSDARRSLNTVPLAQLLYRRMSRDYMADQAHFFRIMDATGPAGAKVFERVSGGSLEDKLTGFYTADAYRNYFRGAVKDIARKSSDENWVLNPAAQTLSGPEVESLQQQLYERYFADYIRFWEAQLNDLRIVRFGSLAQASEVLSTLSGQVSPLRSVLQATARNTRLAASEGAVTAAVADAAAAEGKSRLARLMQSAPDKPLDKLIERPEKVVDDHFESLNALVQAAAGGAAPLDQTLDLISQLYGQMDGLSMGVGGDVLTVAAGSGGAETVRRIQIDAARQPEPVKSWMTQVAAGSRSVTMRGARAEINNEWQAKVLPACTQSLQGRYPIYQDGAKEMTLVDFGRMFGPGGLIDGFFQQHLQPFVGVSGGRWTWKPVGDVSLGLSAEVLAQFQRAALIRDMFFRRGGSAPSLSFSLKPVYLDANVRSVNLEIEGQSYVYRHGPARRQSAQWPGPEPGLVRVEFKDDSGANVATSRDGHWALFRLLDESVLQPKGRDEVLAEIRLQGRKATWALQADSVVNPFLLQELRKFRCPSSL